MRILVAGAGAVGSWIGGELAAGGAEVVLVVRGDHGRAMADSGLSIEPEDRPAFRVRVPVQASLADALPMTRFDLALVCVKSYATTALAGELRTLSPEVGILSLQNGVGNEALLARHLPDHQIFAGSVTKACIQVAPGRIGVGAKGGIALAGDDRRLSELSTRLQDRGIPSSRHADAAAMKWSKLLLNMLGAATSAALDWPPARIFENRALFSIELEAWRETLEAMTAGGIATTRLPGYPVSSYAQLVRWLPDSWLFRLMAPRLARGRGDRLPGPAADLAAGKAQTEIGWLNGAVAELGRSTGVATPINDALNTLVADLAAGRADRERFAGRPEALLAWLDRAGHAPREP